MQFVLHNVRNGCRIGRWVDEVGHSLETPLCMLYTRGGSAPYLTRDVLNRISILPEIVQMPLNRLAEHFEMVKKFKDGVHKFTAMQGFLIYCTLQDAAETVQSGYNDNAGVSVWGRGGKLKMNSKHYMDVIEAFQPDWFQALCDSDTDQTSSKKRIKKSVDRTINYLDECIERLNSSEVLRKTKIMGVIEGGYDVNERLRSANETIQRPVAGFCIEGFHNFGPNNESFKIANIEDLLKQTIAVLPENKPRLLPGISTTTEIISAVRLGIDIFDSSYPYMATERGSALSFDLSSFGPSNNIPSKHSNGEEEKTLEISLKDKRFFDDFHPIISDCDCYTCDRHTRSYIHHLLMTSELLGGVLLMIHNFHHYFRFFQVLREVMSDDKLDDFERHLSKHSTCVPLSVDDKSAADEK